MNNNTVYIIVGIMVFLLIAGGIVIAVKKLGDREDPTKSLTFFHLNTNASAPSATAHEPEA